MTDHPHQLYAIEFTEADQARLVGFSCGDEPWSKHVTEWILGSDVHESMKRGTRVWLFETARSEVVGFGSVGTSVWQWPPPQGARTTIVLIPMLGVDARFRGQPPDLEWGNTPRSSPRTYGNASKSCLAATGARVGRQQCVETEEDERALADYVDAIEQAQAMDRAHVRCRAAEEFDTDRIADRVIGALEGVREFTVSHATSDDRTMGGQIRRP